MLMTNNIVSLQAGKNKIATNKIVNIIVVLKFPPSTHVSTYIQTDSHREKWKPLIDGLANNARLQCASRSNQSLF